MKLILAFLLFFSISMAEELSSAKLEKLIKKGEKISLSLCDKEKLKQIEANGIDAIVKSLELSSPCGKLSGRNKKALAFFIMQKESNTTENVVKIEVPKKVKCPVCGMFVNKYPKWSAFMSIEGKVFYFDGVKDMMKYYIFDADFPYDRKKIEQIEVTNFYTLSTVPAKEAFYVLGSDVYGPMGNELIPFSTRKEAENFKADHKGESIIEFKDITGKMVMALDGIEY